MEISLRGKRSFHLFHFVLLMCTKIEKIWEKHKNILLCASTLHFTIAHPTVLHFESKPWEHALWGTYLSTAFLLICRHCIVFPNKVYSAMTIWDWLGVQRRLQLVFLITRDNYKRTKLLNIWNIILYARERV